MLEEDNADYADILRGRFWEGHTVTKMRMSERPHAMGETAFYNYQRKAIKEFVSIFRQKEEVCWRREQALEAEGDERQESAEQPTTAPSKPIEQESEAPTRESVPSDEHSSLLDTPLASTSSDAATDPPEFPDMAPAPFSEPKAKVEQTASPFVTPIRSLIALVVLLGLILLFFAYQFITGSQKVVGPATEAATEPSFIATSSPTQTQNGRNTEPTISAIASPTPPSRVSICGEESRLDTPPPPAPRFEHRQGVSAFKVDNTPDLILNNNVRSVAIDSTGLWIGYYDDDLDTSRNGLTHFDKQTWADCNQPGGPKGKNIQAIAFDSKGNVWMAAEGRVSGGGVSVFDGQNWYTYTTEDGLPSNNTFGLTIDENDHVWVATWEGLAKFDGKKWTTPYSKSNGTLFDDHIHAMAIDSANNIWIGHINQGVSLLKAGASEWVHHTTETELGGNEIRKIAVRPATENSPESVWLATGDGGITKYEQETWTIYNQENGLPSNKVEDVAIDKYNRVWVATTNGVLYLTDSGWVTYNTLKTRTIAFGPACQDCPYNDEHVWTGTFEMGATHSRLPYPDAAIDVIKACFERTGQEPTCHFPTEDSNNEVAIITYPEPLTPGEEVRLEIRAAPRSPYELRQDRGDFLRNLAPTEEERYGTWIHMLVEKVVHSGEPFAFTDHEFLLKVPNLANGETFSSSWRVWMHTRYTGPEIRLLFTVGESEEK